MFTSFLFTFNKYIYKITAMVIILLVKYMFLVDFCSVLVFNLLANLACESKMGFWPLGLTSNWSMKPHAPV